MFDDIKEILKNLVFAPRQDQIQIDFDSEERIFILSIPIYVAKSSISRAVKKYVERRKNRVFKPHATSFHLEADQEVLLIQKIPFRFGLDFGSRQEIFDFLQLAKRCHRMLYEIAFEETYQSALSLDSSQSV